MPQVTNMLPKLDSILAGLNTIVNNPALTTSVDRIDDIIVDIETSTSQLSMLMNSKVPSMLSNIDTVSTNLKSFTSQLNDVEIAQIMSSVDSTLTNIRELTDMMTDKNSTIGMLFNDSGMYDGVVKALQSADSLLIDLKEHPKRYVHFSLFGKKEK